MIFPKFLTKGSGISVIAPSAGIGKEKEEARIAKEQQAARLKQQREEYSLLREAEKIVLEEEIQELINLRNIARQEKNWSESDRIRDILIQKGYNVKDSKEGTVIEKR